MATLAVTNDFSAGTTIVASEMNTNFGDIETFVNTTPGVVQKRPLLIPETAKLDNVDAIAKSQVATN